MPPTDLVFSQPRLRLLCSPSPWIRLLPSPPHHHHQLLKTETQGSSLSPPSSPSSHLVVLILRPTHLSNPLSLSLYTSISPSLFTSLDLSVSLCPSVAPYHSHGFPLLPRSNPTSWPCGVSSPPPPLHPGSLDFFHIQGACCSLPNRPSHSPCN